MVKTIVSVAILSLTTAIATQEDLPAVRADLAREAEHYRIVDVPIPPALYIEATSFLELADGRIAIGTRRGEVFFASGLDDDEPQPRFHLFASGLHEVFGLAMHEGQLYATQQCEVTRLVDRDSDGRADRFDTISDGWGFGGEHEYTFGSDFDHEGNLWVVCCLTGSYTSDNAFRGWCLRIAPDGTTLPTCSGIRSPGGVTCDVVDGQTFYTESQGPWNSACSVKHLRPGGFMGHPISTRWYERAPNMGPRPPEPTGGREGRLLTDLLRMPQLVPPAVILPYKKTCQSASKPVVDRSDGGFGPFAGQLFIGDYTLSLVMRVFLENIDGTYQGACFPFREGFRTGLIGALLTRRGHLLVGGCSRGWPTRATAPFALQRVDWTGKTPFEVREMRARADGFELLFTQPVDPASAADAGSYTIETYTYNYHGAYGGPEIESARPPIRSAQVSADGLRVQLAVELRRGCVHELHAAGVRSAAGTPLLHEVAYYTVNRVPR